MLPSRTKSGVASADTRWRLHSASECVSDAFIDAGTMVLRDRSRLDRTLLRRLG